MPCRRDGGEVKMTVNGDLSPLEKARRKVAENPDSAEARVRLGTMLAKALRLEDAEAELLKAIEIDSGCLSAWINLGGVKLSRFDFQGCVEANGRAVEVDPGCAIAWYNKGLGHLYLGQAAEMEACFRRVVEIEPSNAGGAYHLAVALHALGRTQEAYGWYRKCLSLGYEPQPEFIRQMQKYEESINRQGKPAVLEFGPDSPAREPDKPKES